MAFDINNIKEVGGPGNSQEGGQVYSLWSEDDTLTTMLADSYLDEIAYKLNPRDLIIVTGTDGAVIAQIVSISVADVVVVLATGANVGFDTVTGAGAMSAVTAMTILNLSGAVAVTLAAGAYEGQMKTLVMIAASGTATITPATFLQGTSLLFNAAGDSGQLMWTGDTNGWSLTGGTNAVSVT